MKKICPAFAALLMCVLLNAVGQAEGTIELSGYMYTDIDAAIMELDQLDVMASTTMDLNMPVSFTAYEDGAIQWIHIENSSDFSIFAVRIGMKEAEMQNSLGSNWELTNQYTIPTTDSYNGYYSYTSSEKGLLLTIRCWQGEVKSIGLTTEFGYYLEDAGYGEMMIAGYDGSDSELVLPSAVRKGKETYPLTRIGMETFEGNLSLESITIPEGYTIIDDYTFDGCKNLVFVSLPSTIEYIGSRAFYNCDSLAEFSLPESIFITGDSASDDNGRYILAPKDMTSALFKGKSYVVEEVEEDSFIVDVDNLVELVGYLGAEFLNAADAMGLTEDKGSDVPQYSNDAITINSKYGKIVESIYFHYRANYSIAGACLGMAQQDAYMAALNAGWNPIESIFVQCNEYQDNNGNSLNVFYDDNGMVKEIYLGMNDDAVSALGDEY